jgi:peptidyl-prolyl cis-trans isomerase B (cyclophilin B)
MARRRIPIVSRAPSVPDATDFPTLSTTEDSMKNHAGVFVMLLTAATLAASLAPADAKTPAAKPHAKTAAVATATADKALAAIDAQIADAKVDKKNPSWRTSLHIPKVAEFSAAKSYLVHMATNKGAMTIRFMPEAAPMHVTNFIYLSRLGFYDGLTFHRVIPGFMAQGGDPLGNGAGSPGYQFAGEFSPKATHARAGMLSTANAGPGTDGSQFFITFGPQPRLDGGYTVFGEVIEGLDVLKKLEAAGSSSGATTERLTIDKCTIEVK